MDSIAVSSAMSSNNNQQILERFLASIKSDQTRRGAVKYIHAYMKYWKLYEVNNSQKEVATATAAAAAKTQEGSNNNNNNKIDNDDDDDNSNNFIYRYDWLLSLSKDVETLQDRIIQFVIYKAKQGLGAKGIENYTNHLRKFFRVNGVKPGIIDWDLIKSYTPENVKKTQDREYYANEVIAIEEKLDVRGKVVSGVMRGSGVRRGAEGSISVGDLIPKQTRYGKIYKIWVYRGSREMYATACIPEVAKRIDDYFEYRMRFGEACKQYENRVEHKHEYYDGTEEVIEKKNKTRLAWIVILFISNR